MLYIIYIYIYSLQAEINPSLPELPLTTLFIPTTENKQGPSAFLKLFLVPSFLKVIITFS